MSPFAGLLLGLAVEGPVVVGFGVLRQGRSTLGSWLLLVVGANLLTYFPFVAAAAALRPRWGETVTLAILETVVALVEGTIYARAGRLGWWRGLTVAAIANALSFGAGVLVTSAA